MAPGHLPWRDASPLRCRHAIRGTAGRLGTAGGRQELPAVAALADAYPDYTLDGARATVEAIVGEFGGSAGR